jgi:cephalosporin-C deacetylase
MPCLDMPLNELEHYTGRNPRPADFDDYWERALEELATIDPAPALERDTTVPLQRAETFNLWFRGVDDARIYAKYVRPRNLADRVPVVLEFHGYAGDSGDWCDKLRYTSENVAVVSMDCRGQGGRSEDRGGIKGNTLQGHIIRGLEEHPDKLLFRQIFLDTVQLARIVAAFEEIDETRMAVHGGSQGGALAIACAALEPRIRRCVSVYPFLSDYLRVWEMDLAKDAYAELHSFFRRRDPLSIHRQRLFEWLGYIDIHHLAPRIQADVIMGLTLQDAVCPPSTQFAVYNTIRSRKRRHIYADFGHEALPGLTDLIFGFLTWNESLT